MEEMTFHTFEQFRDECKNEIINTNIRSIVPISYIDIRKNKYYGQILDLCDIMPVTYVKTSVSNNPCKVCGFIDLATARKLAMVCRDKNWIFYIQYQIGTTIDSHYREPEDAIHYVEAINESRSPIFIGENPLVRMNITDPDGTKDTLFIELLLHLLWIKN